MRKLKRRYYSKFTVVHRIIVVGCYEVDCWGISKSYDLRNWGSNHKHKLRVKGT